jgi:hypothetical protein
MELTNLNGSIACLEAIGLSTVFAAYAVQAAGEDINSIGFNPNSGYVYIYLENGISICSAFGHPVEYLVYNQDIEQEESYNTYNEAINNL